MDVLAEIEYFTPPSLTSIEVAMEYGLSLRAGRVFTDLWDLSEPRDVRACFSPRIERLREMNVTQTVSRPIACEVCKL